MNQQGTLNLSSGDRQLEPAPCALGSRTSRAAAGKLTDRKLTEREDRVCKHIEKKGAHGAIDREAAKQIGMERPDYTSARNALVRKLKVRMRKHGGDKNDGTRICAASGMRCSVWIVNAPAGGEVNDDR